MAISEEEARRAQITVDRTREAFENYTPLQGKTPEQVDIFFKGAEKITAIMVDAINEDSTLRPADLMDLVFPPNTQLRDFKNQLKQAGFDGKSLKWTDNHFLEIGTALVEGRTISDIRSRYPRSIRPKIYKKRY